MVEVLIPPAPVQPVSSSLDDHVSPLSDNHVAVLSAAEQRFEFIMGSARAATFNAYTSVMLAVMAAPFAMFSFVALLVSLTLAYVAYVDLDGRSRLRRLEPGSPRRLGRNQLVLLGAVVIYCFWSVLSATFGPNPYEAQIRQNPEIAEMLGPIADLYVTFTILTYTAVLIVSLVVQGLTSLYHFKRERLLAEHLKSTPQWVLDLQRQRGGTSICSR